MHDQAPVAWLQGVHRTGHADARSITVDGMTMQERGAYPADRAAALSGVPVSTVHYWSRNGILIPSLSPERVKLWSYGDLMALRIVYWLRQTKTTPDGAAIPRTRMSAVKSALSALAELDLSLWSEEAGPRVKVDRGGHVIVLDGGEQEAAHRQRKLALADDLDVTAPFATVEGGRGPDLHSPRPMLRIVPGKLGGSPHVLHTRLESQAVAALETRGLPTATIYRLYPDVSSEAIDEAIDLEAQLQRNLQPLAA
jgi:uncharacterized protein (DUF433 family)